MAVKTSDFIIDVEDFTIDGFEIDANKKTAIRIDGLTSADVEDLEMGIEGDNLVIAYGDNKLLVSNYSKLKYIKTDYVKEGKKETYNLYDIIANNAVDNFNAINSLENSYYNAKKQTVTGTNYNDKIDFSESGFVPTKGDKGITFNGGNGSDDIVGTDYNDVFKGGNGSDNITGGAGNDTITGGAGYNTINYTFGAEKSHGNDVINLTKGENLTIKIDDLTGIKYEYSSNKKDLIIYKEKVDGEYVESITLKNFASKDVTNNSTKKTDNTSSVILTDGNTEVNLREDSYLYGTNKIVTEKSFTGTWLDEEIDATSAPAGKNNKGVTIKGMGGDDDITGSQFNDTITGGAGANTIRYTFGNGDDVINLTKGEELRLFIDGNDIEYRVASNKKDLEIISTTQEGKLTLKNYCSKELGATVLLEGVSDLSKICGFEDVTAGNYFEASPKVKTSYTGSVLADDVDASGLSQAVGKNNKGVTIKTLAGDDDIKGSNFNDTITAGTGNNEFVYSFADGGDGNDVVNLTNGETLSIDLGTINFSDLEFAPASNKKDLVITYKGVENSSITLKNYYSKELGATVLINGVDLTKEFNLDIQVVSTSSAKGSALADHIVASEYKEDVALIGKGTSINAGGGDDEVLGSKHNDTIKGGNGDDIIIGLGGDDQIYGEAGKNTFVFEVGHGNDTVYSGKGIDTLLFMGEDASFNSLEQVLTSKGKGTKDAIISYGDEGDTVTIKNFFNIDKNGNVINSDSSIRTIKFDHYQLCISGSGADLFTLDKYGNSFDDRMHTTVIMGADSVQDVISLTDKDFHGNAGNFQFIKDGNDLKIWYNTDPDLSNTIEQTGVQEYKGSSVNKIGEDVYCSSITIQGYFETTAENCTIDKFVINGTEYSILENYEGTFYLDKMGYDASSSNTFYGTRWNDEIWSRSGGSIVDGDTIYAGDGDDEIISGGGWLNSFYGENGDDEIIVGANDVLADGGAGRDTIIHRGSGTINPNGTRIIGGIGNDELQGHSDINIKTMFEFKKGDGQDKVTSTSGNDIIKITDCEHSAITYEKDGDNILIKYGESDVITVKDALKNLAKIMVEDQNGEKINLLAQLNIFVGDGKVTGSEGNDTLYGRDGADVLIGGKGTDTLIGQNGTDTYEFNTGDGIDTVVSGKDGVNDKLKFNDIDDVRDFEFNIADNEKDLVISYGDNDKVIVQNYFEYGNTVTTWVDKEGNEHAIATDNNHTIDDIYSASITGTIFNDYIKVNPLNKSIAGGEGANTYEITADDVARTITTTSGRDTIKFDTEISKLTFNVKGNDVTIKGEKIDVTIKNYLVDLLSLNITDSTNTTSKLIENLASAGYIYSDEEHIIGTDNSENIFGGDSANIIQSKKGNDLINGGLGNDTYQFTKGDGYDSVINGTEANEVDTIFFIDSELSELTYSKSGNDLIINYSNSDSVTIKNYYTENNTVKKFKVFDYDLGKHVEYDIEKDLKNNIHATSTTVSGTEKNDRIWGTDGEDTISDDKGFNEFIGGNGADTYLINGYGEGIADTVHNTIVMGTDNVVDTIKLVDNNFDGNAGNFQFDKVGDDLRIWYNYDYDIVEDTSFISGVNKYNGTEIYYTGSYAYCSSLIIKDYFKSTAENCTIDKFVLVNEDGERQFSILERYQGTFDLDDMDYDASSSNTFYGTRWSDYIWARSGGSSVDGDTVYAGDGNDKIVNSGWRDSFYGENGNDEILIGCNGVLADGGAGNDTITHNRSGSFSPDGTILRGGTGNDTLTSHSNKNTTSIFEFKKDDGNDIINYEGNNSIIKFTDVEITDITFGEYDLENQTLTLSYGTSDSITINGLTPQNNLVKIEDSTGEKYTIYVGYGDHYETTQKPLIDGENAILIGSTGKEYFKGGSGTNIFVSLDYYDSASGHSEGKNIYITTPEENTTIYPYGANNKIIIKDLELSQLNYELDLNSDGDIKITNTENSQVIALKNYTSTKENITIVAKDGETTLLDELPIIFPEGETLDGTETEGKDGNNILIGSGINDEADIIVGGIGDDILFGDAGPDIYVFNKGDGNDVLGRYCGDDAILRFNDSTYEELSFKQLSGNKYQVTYNDGADSVIFYNDQVTKFIVKDNTVEGGYKEYSMKTDMHQYIKGDGVETDLMGSDIKDIFTGTLIDETMTGGEGSNIYNFTTGGGTDTVVISTNTDTINFTDVETGDLTFDINGEDLVIKYSATDKVIVKDYVTELQPITITGANSTSTTALAGFGTTGAQIVNETTATGTPNDDYIICTDIDNTITGGKGNDILSGAGGNNTYIFNKGDGADTIKYSIGNDVIKFNDVKITDITFGEYDLTNKTVTLSYGTSDSLTITGLLTDRNTVKIEDSTGTQYTVIVGDGDSSTSTIQKPNAGENAVFISSTGRDSFDGNTGINVFTNPNNFDYNSGNLNGTNIYLVQPETSGVISEAGDNTEIYFKDLALSELKYSFVQNGSNGNIKITNTKNEQEIELHNFLSDRADPTIVAKDGQTKILDNIDIEFGDEGSPNADIICSNTNNGVISGNGGSDLIIARCSNATIYSNKEGVKDTTVGTVVNIITSNNSEYNIYAQSETNIIDHKAPQYDDGTNYYVYSDQKTTITESSTQPYSALHFLNTDDVNDIDGVHTNLNIVFNVSKDYKTVQGATAIGDVRILDDNNFDNWLGGASYKDITLKNNCIETINSSDGYSITSEQIAQLAEDVAGWLTSEGRDYASVNDVLSSGNETDIDALTAFFTQDSNWTESV